MPLIISLAMDPGGHPSKGIPNVDTASTGSNIALFFGEITSDGQFVFLPFKGLKHQE